MKESNRPVEMFVLTPDNTPQILGKIAEAREEKGHAEQVISQIENVQQQAERFGNHTTVAILYQEKLLCAQHIIMENKKNPIKMVHGLSIMKATTDRMMEYQKTHENNIDPLVIARSSRFLGRQADHFHLYAQSEKHYRDGLHYFASQENVDQNYPRLELAGFLAFSLLKQHKPEWYSLTEQTLTDFDTSKEGIWLKDNNYYTWAVWKSGIEIRNSDALLQSNTLKQQYATEITRWLTDADAILQIPEGCTYDFGIRRQELNEVIQRQK